MTTRLNVISSIDRNTGKLTMNQRRLVFSSDEPFGKSVSLKFW
jgi:hypothetical protein